MISDDKIKNSERHFLKIKLVRDILVDYDPDSFVFSKPNLKCLEKELGCQNFFTSIEVG